MSTGAVIAIAIAVLVVLAGIVLVTTARRGDAHRAMGSLSRETRRRDRSAVTPGPAPGTGATGREIELAATESRRGAGVGTLERAADRAPAPYVPPDPDQVAFTRRQFFNRGNFALMNVSIIAFGAAVLAFLWPRLQGGAFGSTIAVGNADELRQSIRDGNGFYYLAAGRTWITEYPATAIPKAEKVYASSIVEGMRSGFVALYQKCPHLGCRVPQCITSQWFECPCHGSQYNRVGEKKAGPAPRGMDHFVLRVTGGNVSVDTKAPIPGPPIGTNTTGQEAEGPHCITGGGE